MPAPMKSQEDTVEEAVFEVRFRTSMLPDLVVGSLANLWPKLTPVPNQMSNIPGALRRADANLRIQPLMDLKDKTGRTIINIGEEMVGFHTPKRYPGWVAFRSEIEANLKTVRERLPAFSVERLGLRYINWFHDGVGRVSDFGQFPLKVRLGEEPIETPLMLMYSIAPAKDLTLRAMVTSRGFINETAAPDVFAVADYDAFTQVPLGKKGVAPILAWAERAHSLVKSQYAKLVPDAF